MSDMTYWASSELAPPPMDDQDEKEMERQQHEAWAQGVVDWLREEACRDVPEPWPCDTTVACLRYAADYLEARHLAPRQEVDDE